MQYIYNKKEIIYTGKKLTMLDKIVIDFLSYIDGLCDSERLCCDTIWQG